MEGNAATSFFLNETFMMNPWSSSSYILAQENGFSY